MNQPWTLEDILACVANRDGIDGEDCERLAGEIRRLNEDTEFMHGRMVAALSEAAGLHARVEALEAGLRPFIEADLASVEWYPPPRVACFVMPEDVETARALLEGKGDE